MARPIDLDQLMKYPLRRGSEHCDEKNADPRFLNGVESILEWAQTLPTLTPPNEWVSVENALPEDEARQYIEDDLDGIGYLYPCLLTYKSPNTERIHVVRFYYDIIQKWFVNNEEELCEKGRCIAWMPLPAPYDRRPPEGEEDNNDGMP